MQNNRSPIILSAFSFMLCFLAPIIYCLKWALRVRRQLNPMAKRCHLPSYYQFIKIRLFCPYGFSFFSYFRALLKSMRVIHHRFVCFSLERCVAHSFSLCSSKCCLYLFGWEIISVIEDFTSKNESKSFVQILLHLFLSGISFCYSILHVHDLFRAFTNSSVSKHRTNYIKIFYKTNSGVCVANIQTELHRGIYLHILLCLFIMKRITWAYWKLVTPYSS